MPPGPIAETLHRRLHELRERLFERAGAVLADALWTAPDGPGDHHVVRDPQELTKRIEAAQQAVRKVELAAQLRNSGCKQEEIGDLREVAVEQLERMLEAETDGKKGEE